MITSAAKRSKLALYNSVNTNRFISTNSLHNTSNLSNSNIPKSENNITVFSAVDRISQSGQVNIYKSGNFSLSLSAIFEKFTRIINHFAVHFKVSNTEILS